MNFDLSSDQKLLVESASTFVRRESPIHRARKLRDDDAGYEPTTWKQLAELGWLGLVFPESVGGLGGDFVDLALILEQVGTTLLPEPIIPSIVLGGTAVIAAGTEAQAARWLSPVLAGDEVLALAHDERGTRYGPAGLATKAARTSRGFELTGEKELVENGHTAATLVVSALYDGEPALFAVPRASAKVTPFATMDGRRAARVSLAGVEVAEDARLSGSLSAEAALAWAHDRAAAAACAEAVGILRTMLDMTTDYLRTREQFGVKIGSFQALQHRAVDMFVEVELQKSASMLAMLKVDVDDRAERERAVSLAKAQLSMSGRFVAQQAIQLHGGIGVTDEHDIGLYFKRAHALMALYGDEEHHTARLASLPSFAD